MKSLLLTLTASLLFLQVSFTQKISGALSLSDGKPAEYATITLHAASDSSVVKGTLSGADGSFEFTDIQPGRYTVSASLIGSGAANLPAFDYAGGDFQLQPLTLHASDNKLAEVTIVARKPTIEMKADKTILNVEGTINSTGLNALELLRKAPGVVVDNNE
ncbi:MAG TPA: carboxypeptidase-like regulatory domain-containing protein, partial [Saprospiraceae bacterium]|nr:carboxypeptidase-like regulatory domain-containing protein [Saprospiraceae bacterium]